MCGALRHGGIKAGATLLDRRKVETRRVRDGLKKIGVTGVRVRPGNCRMLAFEQIGDGLREDETGLQVRVVIAAAVTSPPARVNRELHEVGKAQLPAGSGRGAAR